MTADDIQSVIPRPASTLMLLRDRRGGLEVLMVERASTLKFAPGCLVFPGGALDKTDDHPMFKGTLTGRFDDRMFRIGALREAYEEVGLFAGRGPLRARSRRVFHQHIKRMGSKLDLGALVPFAHWVTPIGPPKRFDTHFYVMRAPKSFVPRADGGEVIQSLWVRPYDILQDWEEGAAKLMFPTRLTLMKLARADRVAAALKMAKAEPPVRVLPELEEQNGKLVVRIPSEAGYALNQSDVRDLIAEKTVKTREKA